MTLCDWVNIISAHIATEVTAETGSRACAGHKPDYMRLYDNNGKNMLAMKRTFRPPNETHLDNGGNFFFLNCLALFQFSAILPGDCISVQSPVLAVISFPMDPAH